MLMRTIQLLYNAYIEIPAQATCLIGRTYTKSVYSKLNPQSAKVNLRKLKRSEVQRAYKSTVNLLPAVMVG
jgi:hypothetical protein